VKKQLWKILCAGLVSCCFIGTVETNVVAQQTDEKVQSADSLKAVQAGIQLERSRRWLDAIEHYEKSLKEWDDNRQLKYGLRRAKIHFGIERRYTDDSFNNKLLIKTRHDALSLFDTVLSNTRRQYVEPLSSTSFVAHGTESLYLALGNPKFLKRNLPMPCRSV